MNNIIFNKILIIGLGLIGGSIAKTIKKNKLSNKVFGFDEDFSTIESAKKQGIIDDFRIIDDEIKECDLIIIASPLNSYKKIFNDIYSFINEKNLVIDLGSIKDFSSLNLKLPKNFIGCHPIAGKHLSGFENSESDLFENKKFIICKDKNNFSDSQKIENFIKKIVGQNGEIEFLDSKKHDKIFALTSHLPQFLSFLTKEFSPKNLDSTFLRNAFRLDDSSPEIWSDIFRINEINLEKYYQEFFDNISDSYKSLLETNYNSYQQLAINYNLKLPIICDDDLFNNEFPALFFRFLVVINYLKINDLKDCLNYTGSGFADFTSLLAFSQLSLEKIRFFIKKDLTKIKKYFSEIS
jgi:prephenate dehydrogenase